MLVPVVTNIYQFLHSTLSTLNLYKYYTMSSNIDKLLQDLGTALKSSTAAAGTSRGIVDTATREQLIITDNGVETGVLKVERIAGNLTVEQSITTPSITVGNTADFNNLKVKGKLEAEVLQVKRIVSDQSEDSYSKSITFSGTSAQDLDGKGMLWSNGDGTEQFVYRAEPKRFFSTASIDLYRNAKYLIDGVDVLDKMRLGNSVIYSNLQSVGTLDRLTVSGDVTLADSVFIGDSSGRLGINTDQPKAPINIVDNDADVVIGVDDNKIGYIGTWANNAFSIITDNTKRITVTGSTTEFGNETSNNAVVKIHGSLQVKSIIADTRVERTASLEYVADKDNSTFGKGLVWKGNGITKQLILMPNPDRIYTSESFDLAIDRAYHIDRKLVLSSNTLGEGVVNSSLTNVGSLTSLTVLNNIDLGGALSIVDNVVTFNNSVSIKDGSGITKIAGNGITVDETFTVNVGQQSEFRLGQSAITIGNQDNTGRLINAYGRLAVNVTNPSEDVSFSVNGIMEVNGKKFANAETAPINGQWTKGDIIWNTNPQETSYVGWVCTMSGSPGTWKPFGYIG